MTVKQRILHVIDTLDRSDTSQQLGLLARELPPDEFETHVCALHHGGPLGEVLTRAGIPLRTCGRRWSADPLAFWRLVRHLKEVQPDVVIGWQALGRAYTAAAARRGIRRWVAVWREIEAQSGPFGRTVDRYAGCRASAVVAANDSIRDDCAAWGIAAGKIHVVPGGTGKPASPAATRGQILERLGLPPSSRLIGWADRLLANRGGKDAIWGADLLKVIRDDAHLLMFGSGPHRDRLIRFRGQVEIADRVHFLGDRGDFDEILPHLDQFWSTRRLAGQPQAVLQAMAAGVPVVATDLPGIRDVITHDVTGYLVAPGHRAGIARWADYLLNHAAAAAGIGAAGRARMETEFSAEKMVERWRTILSPAK
jgi:glycosyltransferase involved in cell wall biosynthesis